MAEYCLWVWLLLLLFVVCLNFSLLFLFCSICFFSLASAFLQSFIHFSCPYRYDACYVCVCVRVFLIVCLFCFANYELNVCMCRKSIICSCSPMRRMKLYNINKRKQKCMQQTIGCAQEHCAKKIG